MAMGHVFEIAFAISATLGTGFRGATTGATNQMKQLGNTAKSISAQQKQLDQAWKASAAAIKVYERQLESLKGKLESAKEAEKQYQVSEQQIGKAMDTARVQWKTSLNALRIYGNQIASLKQCLDQGKITANQYQVEMGKIGKSMARAQANAAQYHGTLRGLQQQLDQTKKHQSQLQQEINKTQLAQDKIQQQLRTQQGMKTAGMSAEEYRTHLQRLQQEMDKTRAAQAKLQQVLMARSSAMANFSAASSGLMSGAATVTMMAVPIASMIQTAATFEAAMSKVKAITSSSEQEIQQLTNQARELGE